MFQGVVHANARKIIASYIPRLPNKVQVICSGNFSVETTLRLNGYEGAISGCDVSLYTSALGSALCGKELEISLSGKFPELEALQPFMKTREGRAAAIAIVLDMMQFEKRNNRFQMRMWDAYVSRLKDLCEKTILRIQKKQNQVQLNAFYAEDGWDRVDGVSKDSAILSFPPTYSNGYEKLYKTLQEAFVWSPPKYKELTSGTQFASKLRDWGGKWLLAAENPPPEMEEVAGPPISFSPRGTGVNIYLYSNIDGIETRVLRRKQKSHVCRLPRLQETDDVTSDSQLELIPMAYPEAQYIREIYVSTAVAQSPAQFCYGLLLDKKLFALMMFQQTSQSGFLIDGEVRKSDLIYMMCDLTLPSNVDKISKLTVMCALSQEVRESLQKRLTSDISYLATTAFSANPVSMKYRGVMQLYSRKQEGNRFALNYTAKYEGQTLEEIKQKWLKKYRKTSASDSRK
ncbi:hypothetical protein SH668x_001217 [Planctomicrobium sp. SH668]|uniref:putative antirestriction adenine methyltransferase n=1 Tax=Planctomicrobium sp. SH668 TaxID=3448126 RepID=UPI003F5C7584